MFCFFESSDSGFTRHGGKPLEKLFESLSAFQIVEESLDGHSRSTKHRSSAKNIRVFDDDSHGKIVSRRVCALMANRVCYGTDSHVDRAFLFEVFLISGCAEVFRAVR